MRFVERAIDKSHLREYIMDKYGEKALTEDGEIRYDFLRKALNELDPNETMLAQALKIEMSLEGGREDVG